MSPEVKEASAEVKEDKAIYKHAFWLYGVIIGLAIKQALDSVLPHWINPGVAPDLHPLHGKYLEWLRLFVFLFLAIRFYLGSAYYFGQVHESDSADKDFPHRSFGTDFVLGFLHFLGFIFLASAIHVHTGEPMRLFPLGIIFVLGFDGAWFLYSLASKLDSRKLIKWWAIVNVGTGIICIAVYWPIQSWHGSMRAEMWVLWVVFVITLFDIGWMMARKPFFQPVKEALTRE